MKNELCANIGDEPWAGVFQGDINAVLVVTGIGGMVCGVAHGTLEPTVKIYRLSPRLQAKNVFVPCGFNRLDLRVEIRLSTGMQGFPGL